MKIEYSSSDRCDTAEVQEVFRKSGIRRPIEDMDRIRKMINHADEIVTARDGQKLVGFLRAITDYSYCCYISDLAVDEEYQGVGIGKKLIGLLQTKLGTDEIQYILISAPGATGFYEKIGLEKADKAYVIKRKR